MNYFINLLRILSLAVLLPTLGLAQNISVTATSGTTSGSYSNLENAFTAINNGVHKGTIAIQINADFIASATASLDSSGSGSASYSSIYIYPNGNRSITGNFNGPVITFNGADNVVINGINDMTNSLTLGSDYTGATGHVVLFQGGASNNSIRNCNLLASPVGVGIVTFGNGDYNNNDSISSCNIGPSPAGGFPQIGIFGNPSGTVNYASDNVIIYNNNIFDFRHSSSYSHSYGISVGTSQNNWKIHGNRFYQTTSVNYAQSYSNYGIYVNNTAGNIDIRDNTIGNSSSDGTGTYTILASSASAAPSFFPHLYFKCFNLRSRLYRREYHSKYLSEKLHKRDCILWGLYWHRKS